MNTRDRCSKPSPTPHTTFSAAEEFAFHFVLRPCCDQQIQLAIDNIIADWHGPLLRRPP